MNPVPASQRDISQAKCSPSRVREEAYSLAWTAARFKFRPKVQEIWFPNYDYKEEDRYDLQKLFPWSDQTYAEFMGFSRIHCYILRLGRNPYKSLSDLLEISADDINAQDRWGRTALFWAVHMEDYTAVDTLLEFRADPNLTCSDGSGNPLHQALRIISAPERQAMVEHLLQAGANTQKRTLDGISALHIAVELFGDSPEEIEILLNAGADANAKEN